MMTPEQVVLQYLGFGISLLGFVGFTWRLGYWKSVLFTIIGDALLVTYAISTDQTAMMIANIVYITITIGGCIKFMRRNL